ncbi:sigma 54-interacting transcriptional regulator [Alteromonas gracilis]|uniref:sigma 54-interacting transcriptional regulator n=1 Tax=Alteromonas gracilis TaxID=1479524 RepID=UPI00321B3168
MIARAIHEKSSRSNNIFITVDLGAVPESIFESELFGHKKGAFTRRYGRPRWAYFSRERRYAVFR